MHQNPRGAVRREGWRAERLLSALFEHEMAERETRRLARRRAESDLPPDKSIDSFDFTAVPSVSKPHIAALVEGDGWLEQGANVLLFDGPASASRTSSPPSVMG